MEILRKARKWYRRIKCFYQRPSFMKTEKKMCTSVPGLGLCDGCKYKDPEGMR